MFETVSTDGYNLAGGIMGKPQAIRNALRGRRKSSGNLPHLRGQYFKDKLLIIGYFTCHVLQLHYYDLNFWVIWKKIFAYALPHNQFMAKNGTFVSPGIVILGHLNMSQIAFMLLVLGMMQNIHRLRPLVCLRRKWADMAPYLEIKVTGCK